MKPTIVIGVLAVLALPLAATAQDSAPRESQSSRGGGIDLGELLDRYARRTGRKFIVDPRVRASVDLAGIDAGQLTQEQLLAILRVHQFVAVTDHDLTVIVPDANARQMTVPTFTDLKFSALDDELVTVLMEPKNACSAQLVPVLRPLMPQAAHLAADVQSNTLIINDRAANARRIGALIERLDRAAPAGRKCEAAPSKGG